MTYSELYRLATGWTARHVAQDLLLMYGGSEQASALDIETVSRWQVKEGGAAICALCEECGHAAHSKPCEHERRDAWVTGNQPSQPTVLMALPPCGCEAR